MSTSQIESLGFSPDLLDRLATPETTLEGANAQRAEALAALEYVEAENVQLRRALADQEMARTLLTEMSMRNGGVNMQLEGGMCRIVAESFADQFRRAGAINYVELRFTADDGLNLLVTLQKTDGKTPGELRTEAEQRAAAAEAQLQAYRDSNNSPAG